MKSLLLITLVLCLAVATGSAQLPGPGIFADVRTSAGGFSINLDYTGARRMVSHFMRLSQGSQPWMDEPSGQVFYYKPFYNGLSFHKRVNQTLYAPMQQYIQTGARYGGDNNGTGYVLRDEIRYNINGTLVKTHSAYTVSMVGTEPHSSSSQFLITKIADASMDGKNSAFGTVEQIFYNYDYFGNLLSIDNGRAVVAAILDAGNDASIISITFRRIGTTALEFNENEYVDEVPLMQNWPITSITSNSSLVSLNYPTLDSAEVRMYFSLDLYAWSYHGTSTDTLYTPAGSWTSAPFVFHHSNSPRAFFRLTAARYPLSTAPAHLYNKKITVGAGTSDNINFIFDTYGVGDYYQFPNGTGGALNYTYNVVGPYKANLDVTFPGEVIKRYSLYFGGTDLNYPAELPVYDTMAAKILQPFEYPIDSHFSISDLP